MLFVIFLVVLYSALSGLLFGYDTGVVSGVILLLKDSFHLSSLQLEVFVSITMGMAAIFSLISGFVSNCIGRKNAILLSSIFYLMGSIFLAVSINTWMLIMGRCILGIAIGFSSATAPIYISECVPPEIRGWVMTIYNGSITFGMLIASIFCGIFSFDLINGWRYMIGIATVPCIIQMIIFCHPHLPKSPRYLILIQRTEESRKMLSDLAIDELTESDLDEIIENMIASCKIDVASPSNICLRVFGVPQVRRALLIGSLLQMFQQFIGINTVLYYTGIIIQMSGIPDVSLAIWYSVLVNSANFVFTFIGLYFVDRIGRRILTLISLAGIFLSLILLASGFQVAYLNSEPITQNGSIQSSCSNYLNCADCVASDFCGFCYDNSMLNTTCLPIQQQDYCGFKETRIWSNSYCPSIFGYISIVGLVLYLFFFAPGMGPMPWTINSEIYPSWSRSFCCSIATFFNWSSNLLISVTFLTFAKIMTIQGVFYVYASVSMLALVFVYLFLPETKSRSLEQMEELFAGEWLVPFRKTQMYTSISD